MDTNQDAVVVMPQDAQRLSQLKSADASEIDHCKPQRSAITDLGRLLQASLQKAQKLAGGLIVSTGLLFCVTQAVAQVNVQDIISPSDIGNQLTATISIDYVRTSSAPGTATIVLPATLGASLPLPAGCVFTAPNLVQCAVPPGPAGAGGLIPFDVIGLNVGAYLLQGQGTGQAGNATSNGSVRDSGDLTVAKTRTAPAGIPATGQDITFRLTPSTVGNGIPSGSQIVVTDQLPGGTTDFNASSAVVTPASAANCVINNAARTVSCTFIGPLSAAAFSAATIDITGTSGNSGNFVNNASIATNNNLYFDRVSGNNTASLSFAVTPGADVVPTGSNYPATSLVGASQTLNLVFRNNGPANLPAGGTVTAQIPAGFTVGALPSGCVFAAPTITCTAGAVNNGNSQAFAIPLGNPTSAAAGNITVTVATPAGVTDYNTGNNTLLLPFSVVPPTGDLAISKAKTGGPLPEGAAIVNTLSVSNVDISTVTFTAAGGVNPLRIIDDMLIQEVFVSASAGWTCSDNPGVPSATQRRVICERTAAGTLAPSVNIPLTINTQVTTSIGAAPLNLTNTACTGKEALNRLGLVDADGPQPRDPNTTNDCQSQGVIGTPVTTGEAQVNIIKESSTDGVNWVDAPASGPTIVGNNEFAFWRIRFATPSTAANGSQQTIPSLVLTDNLPGIFNLAASLPTPAHVTPPITITQQVTGNGVTGSCPANLGPGSGALSCNFTNMQAGTTVTLVIQVKRPFDAGQLDNTASLSSGNAILSGTTSDAARLNVEPRVDPAVTSKTITPPNSATEPRVGQTVSFTITLRNNGVNPVPAGNMTLTDTLDPAKYAIISATGANLNCTFVAATGVVTCPTTNAVPRADVRTAVIVARLIKPAGVLNSPVYPNEINTATVTLSGGLCEFKEETTSNALLSTTCNDANSISNNQSSVTYDIKVPAIDLQTAKSRISPPGGRYAAGDTLRYLIRMQNVGPSRAENVELVDYLSVPPGFTVAATTATLVNNAAADTGFTLDTSKNSTVNCSISTTTSLRCLLSTIPADNFLNNGSEVNFVLEVAYTGPAPIAPVTFQNQVVICAAESALYETRGNCTTATQVVNPGDNNNTASANDTVFPKVDLGIAKSNITGATVTANQPIVYRLTVRNDGPSPIAQIRVADVLPVGLEYVSSTVELSAFVTSAGTTGITPVCAPTPASITAAGQAQTVNCVLDAVGGPFVGSTNIGNTISLLITVKAKVPFFTGPYATNLTNTASVAVGLDSAGEPLAVDPNPANNTATAVVQVIRTSISGKVYEDVGFNREPDGTDPARPNVPITLTGTDVFGNSITLTATTGSGGTYTFDLPPGTYQIAKGADPVTSLADFTSNVPTKVPFGTTTAPVSAGVAATTVAGTPTAANLLTGIQLAAGNAATQYNFGEINANSSIAGFVYLDSNDDGSFVTTATEVGIPGVSVVLTGTDTFGASVTRTVTTTVGGAYSFPGLLPGIYTVTEPNQPTAANGATLPPGTPVTGNGKTTVGSAATVQGTATLPTVTPSAIVGIQLASSQNSVNNNFGEIPGNASIAGRVILDYNNDGILNTTGGTDTGIGGVTVTLTGLDAFNNSINITTVTNASGNYVFLGLFAGTYTVAEFSQQPSTANGASLPSGIITTANGQTKEGTGATAGQGTATLPSVTPSAVAGIRLGAGQASINNNFFEVPAAATISGFVYIDANNNGAFAGPDVSIPGVTITLSGLDVFGNSVNLTTRTDALGAYAFPSLFAGTYTVAQPNQPSTANGATLPAGYSTTINGSTTVGTGAQGVGSTASQGTATIATVTPSRIAAIVLGAGNSSINNNFGELLPATISGNVFLDSDNNGTRTLVTEAPLPNVQITLTGTNDLGQVVNLSTVTSGSGTYSFTGLRPGTYTVNEPTQPVNSANGITTPGTVSAGTAGTPTPVATTPSRITGITLPQGANSPGNNFAEVFVAPPPPPISSSLSGRVWLDSNNNGTVDSGEAGIGGVTVVLTGVTTAGALVTTTSVTAADGSYSFTGLADGTYKVTEPLQPTAANGAALPAGLSSTDNGQTVPGTGAQNQGAATPPLTTPSAIAGIALVAGNNSVNNNFGEVPASTISGFVYTDVNTNGSKDPVDTPLAGVTIILTGVDSTGQAITRTTTTDASGAYQFTGLPVGVYTVTEPVQPFGTANAETNPGTINNGGTAGTATPRTTTPSTISGIRITTPGTDSPNNNFGELTASSISGVVYLDDNGNQVRDGVEPTMPAGITITLTGVDSSGAPVTRVTVTSATGTYLFDNLRPGTYTVTESQPAGFTTGGANPGTLAGGTGGPNSNVISSINLPAGVDAPNYNFGDIPRPSSISGVVYRDDNGSQTRDGAETTMPAGITITLTGVDINGTQVTRVTVTSATGTYLFDNLLPGTYSLTESQPANFGNGGANPGTLASGTGGPNSNVISNLILPAGTDAPNYNFGDIPRTGGVSGSLWRDNDHDKIKDANEPPLVGWTVELYREPIGGGTPTLVTSVVTSATGFYSITGQEVGPGYSIRFIAPSGAIFGGAVNGENGSPIPGGSSVVRGELVNLNLQANTVIPQQSLPVDPAGVVYDSDTRLPIPGAIVNFAPIGACPGYNPAIHLVGGAGNASQTVGADGFYQFLLNPGAPACQYGITITPPAGYAPDLGVPQQSAPLTPPNRPPNDPFLVVPNANAPLPGESTTWYSSFNLNGNSRDVVNNHVPLVAANRPVLFISKVAGKSSVEMGDTVKYTVKVRYVSGGAPLVVLRVVDSMPAGFKLIAGTSFVSVPTGSPFVAIPAANIIGAPGAVVTYNIPLPGGVFNVGQEIELTYRVRVGVGSVQGDGINRAQATSAGALRSNIAQAKVKVNPGVFTSEACIVGKIYTDCNNNHIQDAEEVGVPGVRLYMQDGTYLVSDSEGKYSICGLEPKSHVLKVDQLTLPRGSRLTTTSNRNLGNADSLWLDLKNGEMQQADFAIGSCSNTVLEQVKARRAQGGVRSVDNERKSGTSLKFEGKSANYPDQGTDSANQPLVQPRPPGAPPPLSDAENNTPVPALPAASSNTQGNNIRQTK
jgi:large repetitive protein